MDSESSTGPEFDLGSIELEIDLESSEFEGIEFGYAEFIGFAEPDESGFPDREDFGSGFRIEEDGIYLKRLPKIDLTSKELAALAQHPRGRPDEPVLRFPFTLADLKVFLDWAAHVGRDVPIDGGALLEIVEAQKLRPSSPATPHARRTTARAMSKPEQRLNVIHQWFNSQDEFTRDNIRPPATQQGKCWARHACWKWLESEGFTSPQGLFCGAKQAGSGQTKHFANAWAEFLKQH